MRFSCIGLLLAIAVILPIAAPSPAEAQQCQGNCERASYNFVGDITLESIVDATGSNTDNRGKLWTDDPKVVEEAQNIAKQNRTFIKKYGETTTECPNPDRCACGRPTHNFSWQPPPAGGPAPTSLVRRYTFAYHQATLTITVRYQFAGATQTAACSCNAIKGNAQTRQVPIAPKSKYHQSAPRGRND